MPSNAALECGRQFSIYVLFFGVRPFPRLDHIVGLLLGDPMGWAMLVVTKLFPRKTVCPPLSVRWTYGLTFPQCITVNCETPPCKAGAI